MVNAPFTVGGGDDAQSISRHGSVSGRSCTVARRAFFSYYLHSRRVAGEDSPSYVARIGERIELAQVHKGYIPDVSIVKPPRVLREAAVYAGDSIVDEPQTHLLFDEERRVPYIEIIQRETGEVVTLIEVLSSSNKIGDGREQYLQKQADLLATPVSLVEIDLLREGKPTTLARQVAITQPPIGATSSASAGRTA